MSTLIRFSTVGALAHAGCIADVVPTSSTTTGSGGSGTTSASTVSASVTSTSSSTGSGGAALGMPCAADVDCVAGTCVVGKCSAPHALWLLDQLAPTSATPSPRAATNLVPLASGELLMVGGSNGTFVSDACYVWDATTMTWTAVTLGASSGSATALLGGSVYLDSTGGLYWYDGNGWQAVSATGTPPLVRLYASFAYDPGNDVALLFGGQDPGGTNFTPYNDTWTLSATPGAGMSPPTLKWKQVIPNTMPPTLEASGFVFDADKKVFVLFGGRENTTATLGDDRTFTFDGTDWKDVSGTLRPPRRFLSAMAYDPVRKRTILHGGGHADTLRSDTWEWDGSTWTRLVDDTPTPLVRYWHSMAYSPQTHRMTVFGGADPNFYSNETWELTEYGQACSTNDDCSGGTTCVDLVCCQSTSGCPMGQVCNSPAHPGSCSAL